ncbi:RNA polymerase sigma factor [Emticicia sp. BO119]|uniref:RNA polymerase sigma factor n=1 Tax=Emticicia sp. BO119 TaxID=2757768 RepID=UPI0015F01EA6|nr:sigma-70 family RNA polymerase sigma factor [Emticicia sp. BO119]MBA4851656.1 sigma-70 family RNA polymerase sigma factor [Emticicia sp. BO119]
MQFLKRKSKPQTDAEYIAAFQASGDLNVLGELYERNMEMVFAICYKYLRDEEESKDATMEIFEQLISDLKKHQVNNFKSWLHSVARNYCLMQLRTRKVEVGGLEISDEDFVENEPFMHLTDDEIDLEEDLLKLENCIGKLEHEQKSCVELFYLQEKCYKDIAETTGFDLNKVKSYIQNGKRNLKICMEKNQ